MTEEQYIEHEVKLRVQEEKFKALQGKLNLIIGTALTGVIIPIVLHILKVT